MEEKVQVPFIVDDDLSEEKLRSLIQLAQERKSELDELDFKVSFDMSSTQDKIELAKDVIAMNNTGGGYILLGVANDGTPFGLSKEQYDALDPTPLSNKVTEYATPQDARLLLAKHAISLEAEEPKHFGLLYCPRRRGLPLIMARDGNYSDPGKPGNVVCAFRKHDVYVRRGAQSKPMQSEDMQRFFEEALAASKESWMEEFTKLMAESEKVGRASQLAHQEFTPATLMVDSAAFWRILVSLYRNHDTVGLLDLIGLASQFIDSKWHNGRSLSFDEAKELITSQLDVVLDKLTLVAMSAIRFNNMPVFEECVRSLARLYSLGWTTEESLRGPPQPDVLLWRWVPNAVMTRVYALGAYAIFGQQYSRILHILDLQVTIAPFGQRRQARLIEHPERGRYSSEEVTIFFEQAQQYIEERAALLGILQEEKQDILSWLCQFDFLAGYIRWQQQEWKGFFCFRDARLTMPVVLLTQRKRDQILGPYYDDQSFAEYLRAIDMMGKGRFGLVHSWRLDMLPPDVQQFLNEHPPKQP